MTTKYKLTIAIDDVNPSPKYRILGTPVEAWLRDLYSTFGCKFTLFIPSCYHGQWPISEHRTWINELVGCGMFELAAHGHYHQTSNPQKYGECEFLELQQRDEIQTRLHLIWEEWNKCLHWEDIPVGWRNPGWLCSPMSAEIIASKFRRTGSPKNITKHPLQRVALVSYGRKIVDYVALHYEHNHNLTWNGCKTFFGHDGIQVNNINVHNTDMFMFTSHIAGNHNHNVWSRENYEQFKLSLEFLFGNFDLEPKFLKECI